MAAIFKPVLYFIILTVLFIVITFAVDSKVTKEARRSKEAQQQEKRRAIISDALDDELTDDTDPANAFLLKPWRRATEAPARKRSTIYPFGPW